MQRTTVEKDFSEAARLLWVAIIRRGWTQRDLKEKLKVAEGTVPHLLFGERRAGRELALKIEKLFGISASLWSEEPKRSFSVPGALPVPTAERKRWAA